MSEKSSPPSVRNLSPWLRWGLGLLGGLVLLLLAVWLLLPRWLQGSGARLAGEALGREVSIAAVRFQPWRLGLVLEGVKIAGVPGQAEPLLTLERLDLAVSLRSIRHLAPVLESLRLTRPVLRLNRLAPGRYDIDDLLTRFNQPKAKSDKPDEAPPALALYNIQLDEGQVLFDDRPAGRRHDISELRLSLPFVSTFDTDEKVLVEPQLSGRLNGVAFGSKGEALPFDTAHTASLELKLSGLDMAPYIAYLPDSLPLRLQRGLVDADLALRFKQPAGQPAQFQLGGSIGLREFALQTPAGAPWLAWRELRVALKNVQPLRRQVQLGAISWTGPALSLQRDAAGRLWLPGAEEPTAQVAPAAKAATVPTKPAPVWTFGLDSFVLQDAQLSWRDAALRPAAALKLDGIELKLGAAQWPLQRAVPLGYALRLQPEAGRAVPATPPATLKGEGSFSAEQLALNWQWQDLALEWLAPYLQAQLPLQARGRLAGRGELAIAQPLDAEAESRLQLKLRELGLENLSLAALKSNEPALRLAALKLDEANVDLGGRRVQLGELNLIQPVLQLARAGDGHWNYEALLPAEGADKVASTGKTEAGAGGPAWGVQLRDLNLERGSLRMRDAAVAGGASVAAGQIRLRVQNLAWPARAEAMPAQLSLKLGAVPAKLPGSLQWQGKLGLAPLAASGRLRVERLPLHLLDPYLDTGWGLHLQQAELGLRGEFTVRQGASGWQAQASGDVLLADLLLQQARQIEGQRVVGEDLLSWQALNLSGFKLAMAPGGTPQLAVAEARLNDFYARLIVDEQGRLNLRDLGPQERVAQGSPAAAAAPATSAPAASAAAGSSAPGFSLAIAQTRLNNGRVDFSDHFIRPNYSAELSELQGSLGAFSTAQTAMAPLSLKGKVAGTGLLDISGQLKPGAPLAMDIRAEANDIELAPLSPYAAKYAGYAIERGKFSTRVQYKIDAGGALQANNQIILNQLTFGDKVDSPEATKLPVLFAVALLKDRNGVIDVNLPVSGSINDPEFSVGGLVLKLILNLLGKALTAPFSLLSGGDSADLSQATFVPGSARPGAPEQLDKIAKLLEDRPGLSLTITGWADPTAEQAALQAAQLEAALLAERRRELQRQQTAAGNAQAEAALTLSEAERQRLLKAVYQASKLPNKPRNVLGFAKDIPAAEMRALLLAGYPVSEDGVRQLALERGVAVRDALIAKGIPNSRLFLAAPRLQREAAAAGWVPHADLALGAH